MDGKRVFLSFLALVLFLASCSLGSKEVSQDPSPQVVAITWTPPPSLTKASASAPTLTPTPKWQPTATLSTQLPEVIDSPYGEMVLYQAPESPFAIEVPANWRDLSGRDPRCQGVYACFVSEQDWILGISPPDLGDVGGPGMSLSAYLDIILEDYGADDPGFAFLSREERTIAKGLAAEVLEYTIEDGLVRVQEIWVVQDGHCLQVHFVSSADAFDEYEPLAKCLMHSLRVVDVDSAPTITPLPTPLPTPTRRPQATRPTPTAWPTPVCCDERLLREALASLNRLESYQTTVDVRMFEPPSMMTLYSISAETRLELDAGEVSALEFTMGSPEGLDDGPRMILAEGRWYLREHPEEEWQVLEGEMAHAVLERLGASHFLKPALVENLAEAECAVSGDRIRGQEAWRFHYSDVSLAGLSTLQGITLDSLGAEVHAAEFEISLLPHGELILPVQWQLEFELEGSDFRYAVSMRAQVDEIDVPLEIEIPQDVETPSFFVDLPLPDDAVILLTGEKVLMFATLLPPEDVHALYAEHLEKDGWTATEPYTAEQDGLMLTAVDYSKGAEAITVGVGIQGEETLVAISGSEEQ